MSDFSSLATQRAAELADAETRRAAAAAERDRRKRLESAWQRAFQFDADGFRGLARELDAHGLLAYLGPIAESRRAALDGGDIFASGELSVLELLQIAAEGHDAELADALAAVPELWPDGLGDALDNVRQFVAIRQQHGGELPKEPEPTPTPKPAAVVEGGGVAERSRVAARNRYFLALCEDVGTATHGSPTRIAETWNALPKEEREKRCPYSPGRVNRVTVSTGISRARKERDGNHSKRKRTAKKPK